MRPEGVSPGRTVLGPTGPSVEHIYITLPAGRPGKADSEAMAALTRELNRVATRHKLLRENQPGAAWLVRFDYRRGEQRTHAIHIVTPLARPHAEPATPGTKSARLAIIIDDFGYDRAAGDALFSLPYPLTVSVLPHLAHSTDLAEEASRRGYQVMLHLPMESSNGDKREALELRPGMDRNDVSRLLSSMLETVPHAAGVNNHQGSAATADPELMAAVMPELRERELFFIDSRTTTATVAYDAAVHAGVRAASRRVFLDDTPTREAVERQLLLAEREARRSGSAIAIGHPHPATLQVLQDYLPQLSSRGIRLVFASDVVR